MKVYIGSDEMKGLGFHVTSGDIKDATAEDSNVLSGKSYYNNNGKREGTMPNRGGMSAELAAGGSVSILEGYHDGTGSVRAQDLASQTAGTAAAANIEAGYTAWVNGVEVEGEHIPKSVVLTTYTNNTGSHSFEPSNPRQMPSEVIGKEYVILRYTTTSASDCKMYLLSRDGCYSGGYKMGTAKYDPDTGLWTNTSYMTLGDKGRTYQVIAF